MIGVVLTVAITATTHDHNNKSYVKRIMISWESSEINNSNKKDGHKVMIVVKFQGLLRIFGK